MERTSGRRDQRVFRRVEERHIFLPPYCGSSPPAAQLEIVSDEILHDAYRHCPPRPSDSYINWNSVTKAKASTLASLVKYLATRAKAANQPKVFGLAILQHSVHRGWVLDDVMRLIADLDNFFHVSMEDFHTCFYITINRAPESIHIPGVGLAVSKINGLITEREKAAGRVACNPGKTLERYRRGQLIVQPWKWEESVNGAGLGWTPSIICMPRYIRYIRNYVRHHFPMAK